MEISVRPLLIIALVLALVGGLACLAWSQLAPLASQFGRRPPPTTTVAAPAAVTSDGPAVTYLDQSLGWDWNVTCTPPLQQFLADQLPGQSISAVEVALVDYKLDSQLPFGTVYRDARADGNCFNQEGKFMCQIAVVAGEPGADLDVAATLNTPYTLLDMFLARGANPDAIRQTWSLATFHPLLVPAEEATTWQSSCLHLSRTP